MRPIEDLIKPDSLPVPGVPEKYALHVRARIIEDRQATEEFESIGQEGSRLRHSYETAARLFFDSRMKKFWTSIRRRGLTEHYINVLKRGLTEEAEEFGRDVSTSAFDYDNLVEHGIEMTANHISSLALPPHPYLNQDSKTKRRDLDRVVNSLRATAQVLRSIPYYDVPVLAHLRTEFLGGQFRKVVEGVDDDFIALFNPSLHNQLTQIKKNHPRPQGLTNDAEWEQYFAAHDRVFKAKWALIDGTLDAEEITEYFDSMRDYFISNLHKNALRAFHSSKFRDTDAPESLSEFLTELSNKLDKDFDHLKPDPVKPRPNAKNADLIAFSRHVDLFLRGAFNLSAPSQVAICTNVLWGSEVDATDIRRWRVHAEK